MQCVSHKNIISSENAETAAPRPFTVLMPVFNQCGFVRRAVSSLFSQTYAHWELIIINDGSTDALNEFIADYLTDSRIKYIENPENYGLGYALNRGLDAASYDLIAYLPADDFFMRTICRPLRMHWPSPKWRWHLPAYVLTTQKTQDSLIIRPAKGLFLAIARNWCRWRTAKPPTDGQSGKNACRKTCSIYFGGNLPVEGHLRLVRQLLANGVAILTNAIKSAEKDMGAA